MKKIRKILILSIFILIIAIPNVLAASGTSSVDGHNDTNIWYSTMGDSNRVKYSDSKLSVTINGKRYDAYCIDPNLKLNSNTQLNCRPSGSTGLGILLGNLTTNHIANHLAVRFYAVIDDTIAKDRNLTNLRAALIRYHQLKIGYTNDVYRDCGVKQPSDFLGGDDQTILQAYNMAKNAYDAGNASSSTASSSSSTAGASNGITFSNRTVSNDIITYTIKSGSTITLTKDDFKCSSGCRVVSFTPNGSTGTLKIKVTNPKCNAKFSISYPSTSTGAYICSIDDSSVQDLVININDDNNNNNGGGIPAYYEDKYPCDTPGPDCCEDDPITPGWVEGDIHNCCEDSNNSFAKEYPIDKLFCNSTDYDIVDGNGTKKPTKPKCQADSYKQTVTDADLKYNESYCKLYCTEDIKVEVPKPITAESGRNFKLNEVEGHPGIKSPYITGNKKCRMVIQYDVWKGDYSKKVENQVANYNTYQKEMAYYEIYKKATKEEGVTEDITVSCYAAPCTVAYTGKDGKTHTESTDSDTKSTSCKITYDEYTFSLTEQKYYKVKTILSNNIISKKKDIIESDGEHKVTHRAKSAWNINKESCTNTLNNYKNTYQTATLKTANGSCSSNYTCSMSTSTAESIKEDVESVKASHLGNANSAAGSYDTAVDEAATLENDLSKCRNFVENVANDSTKYKEIYNISPSTKFVYTQVYLNDKSEKILDEQIVDFGEADCKITRGEWGNASHDEKDWGNGTETLNDFKKGISFEKSASGYQNHLGGVFNAYKIFSRDISFQATCSWAEPDNTTYTLTPSGLVSEKAEGYYTKNNREYKVYLTTLQGTYETRWDLTGLGSKDSNGVGKFDNLFKTQGGSPCGGDRSSNNSPLTCTLNIASRIEKTGECNPAGSARATINPEDCNPDEGGFYLFSFKTVDPGSLFPNTNFGKEKGKIGYNWLIDEGPKTLEEIQKRAQTKSTYSNDNLSYSFTLSPKDMERIKEYNAAADKNGGYSDFNLKCKCTSTEGNKQCINCTSNFLDQLENGNLRYDKGDHKVSVWSGKPLIEIRTKYGW